MKTYGMKLTRLRRLCMSRRIQRTPVARPVIVFIFLLAATIVTAAADPPMITKIGGKLAKSQGSGRVAQLEDLTLTVTAADVDGIPTLKMTDGPTGAEFSGPDDCEDNCNGSGCTSKCTLTWTPTVNQLGPYEVTFEAAQGGEVVDSTFTIVVTAYQLSHGFYRIGYVNGTEVRVSRDHLVHTPRLEIDMGGRPQSTARNDCSGMIEDPHKVVAAADGVVAEIVEHFTQCGSGGSPCNNHVWVEHPNGERSKYSHVVTNSVTAAGRFEGEAVSAGTRLGNEGDVGQTSGGGANNRNRHICAPGEQDDCDLDMEAGKCGIHLHFEVQSSTSDGGWRKVVPLICGITNRDDAEWPRNVYRSGETYFADDCDLTTCPSEYWIGSQPDPINGKDIRVYQAKDWVRATDVHVGGSASVAFVSGDRITLKPGFKASKFSYFHGWIGECNGRPIIP